MLANNPQLPQLVPKATAQEVQQDAAGLVRMRLAHDSVHSAASGYQVPPVAGRASTCIVCLCLFVQAFNSLNHPQVTYKLQI